MDQPRGRGQPGSVTSQRCKWTAGARLHCRLQQAPAAAAFPHPRASSRLHESRKPALPDCAAPPNARRVSHPCRSRRPFLTAPPTGRSARRAFDHTIAIPIIHNRDCDRPTATCRARDRAPGADPPPHSFGASRRASLGPDYRSSASRNAIVSAVRSTIDFTMSAPPCPALRSIRKRIGASPVCSAWTTAVSLRACIGSTRSS
jgi:hypothetical protein